MQRTRLNVILDNNYRRFLFFFENPWRKITLLLLFLLLGNFLATVFPPAIGQTPTWDPVVALVIVLSTELFSFFYYKRGDRRPPLDTPAIEQAATIAVNQKRFVFDLLNALKIGLLYGITVSAINVGS